MKKRYSIFLYMVSLLWSIPFSVCAQVDSCTIAKEQNVTAGTCKDNVAISQQDTLATKVAQEQKAKKPSFIKRLHERLKEFSRVDTNYIEKQKYNFTVMLQNTNTIERYQIAGAGDHSVGFAPEPSYKLGPYVGWQWIFLGYTIDLSHLRGSDNRQDFDLSLYSNQVGVDLFYRKTGDNYKIKSVYLGENVDASPLKDVSFDGFKASIKGFNLYYITNHKKFSYPAAYSQSTIQRRSAGSPLFGIGYTKHNINIDWAKFHRIAVDKLGEDVTTSLIDTSTTAGKISFSDYSLSGGYAYNWVFAHNWLFDVSLSLSVSYKRTTNDTSKGSLLLREFDLKNLNLDQVTRLGIVWNNMRWYYGASAVFHAYNYKKKQFRSNTIFGNVNVYIGFNFW